MIDETDLRAYEVSGQHQEAGKKNEQRLISSLQT